MRLRAKAKHAAKHHALEILSHTRYNKVKFWANVCKKGCKRYFTASLQNYKYYGNSFSDYKLCASKIENKNRTIVKNAAFYASVFLIVLLIISCLTPFLEVFRLLYLAAGAAMALLYMLGQHYTKKSGQLTEPLQKE